MVITAEERKKTILFSAFCREGYYRSSDAFLVSRQYEAMLRRDERAFLRIEVYEENTSHCLNEFIISAKIDTHR